jgi:hypothetical protein
MSQTLPPRHRDDTRTDQEILKNYNAWLEACEGERPVMPDESPADSLAQTFRRVHGQDSDQYFELPLSRSQRQRLGLDE